jgi:ubiquinol-cytochrome c reductase cytochrome b subunit
LLFPAKRKTRAAGAGQAGRLAETGLGWLDARTGAAPLARDLVRKAFPSHWSFLLGELALYSLIVLVLTGVYLTLFFDPGMTEAPYEGSYVPLRGVIVTQAYSSTLRISFDVRGGLLIRQIHHWASLLFVAAIGLHMLRIFFTGAFRKPRELNWLVGLTLFVLALVEGFCGYSLPDDLLSGTGLRIAQGIVTSIPIAGTYLAFFVFGGEVPGSDIIPRLYVTHILLVPGILIALVLLHLQLVVKLKHTHWSGPGKTNHNSVGHPAYPQFSARSAGLFFMLFGLLSVLGGLAQINPVWNYGPYRTDQVSTAAQPDWYVGFLEGSLRLMPPFETVLWGHTVMWNVLVPAVVLPALLFLILYAYPFLEQWVTGDTGEHHLCDRPRNRPTRTGFGAAGLTFYAVLLIAGGNDVIAYILDISLNTLTWTLRVTLVVAPVLAFFLAKRLCLARQHNDLLLLTEGEETGLVRLSVSGGMSETHTPLPERQRYTLLAQDIPRPLTGDGEGAGAGGGAGGADRRRAHLARARAALSGWFYADRVEMPVTPAQRGEIEARTTGSPPRGGAVPEEAVPEKAAARKTAAKKAARARGTGRAR